MFSVFACYSAVCVARKGGLSHHSFHENELNVTKIFLSYFFKLLRKSPLKENDLSHDLKQQRC